jgi:pimeloyl-ACP methyl ester carboxylesterase
MQPPQGSQSDELRHSYAVVEGVQLHWATLGAPGAHPPVMLVHGLMDSHLSFREVAKDLARDRVVVLPDLPGCGLSGRPDASYELQWHAQVIAALIRRLDHAQLDVVGHSFGGGVAQMLLLECPERIRRVVLVASGGLGREVGFWLKFATFPHFVEHYGQPFMAFGTRRALGHAHDEMARLDVNTLAAMNAKRGTARAFSRTVRDVIGFGGQTRHFLHRAGEVTSFPPMAVFWGERDALIPIAHGRSFVAQVDGARFKAFADAGHYLHQERPVEFAAALREFLDAPQATPVRLRETPEKRSRWAGALRHVVARVVRRGPRRAP